MGVVITGTGSYVPANVLTNFDLEKIVDTSDAWIRSRTGIETRCISAPSELSTDLMVPAVQKALAMAKKTIDDIDLIIAATSFPDRLVEMPSDILAAKLNARHDLIAIDINAQCASFCWALATAKELMFLNPQYRKVLVASGDTTSKHVDYNDRNSCVLFGDAGGAVILEQSAESGIFGAYRRSDRRFQECLRTDEKGLMHFGPEGGGAMLKGIVQLSPELIDEFCAEYLIDISRIAQVIPHQLNQRIADPLTKALEKRGLPPGVVYDDNIRRYGNCSGSSVPLALDTCYREGKLAPGDLVLLIAWGAGLKIGLVGLYWTLPVYKP